MISSAKAEEIDDTAERILDMIIYEIEKEDAIDVNEFVAYEILDLCEWMSPDHTTSNLVLKRLLTYDGFSDRVKKLVLESCPRRN